MKSIFCYIPVLILGAFITNGQAYAISPENTEYIWHAGNRVAPVDAVAKQNATLDDPPDLQIYSGMQVQAFRPAKRPVHVFHIPESVTTSSRYYFPDLAQPPPCR